MKRDETECTETEVLLPVYFFTAQELRLTVAEKESAPQFPSPYSYSSANSFLPEIKSQTERIIGVFAPEELAVFN